MFKKLIVCGCSLLVSGLLTFASASAQQSTPTATSEIVVTTLNDSGAGSLRQAIGDSEAGGTITFDPSLVGTITLSQTLNISKNVSIDGDKQISLSGDNDNTVFTVAKTVIFHVSTISVENGGGEVGGLLNAGGIVTITDSNFTANSNGAIYNGPNSVMTINQVFFTNNLTSALPLIGNAGTATILNSTFTNNPFKVLDNANIAIIESSLFNNNGSFTFPVFENGNTGNLAITNSTFQGNYGVLSNGGKAALTNDTLSNNNILNRATFSGYTSNITMINSVIVSEPQAVTCLSPIINGGGNIQFPDNDCGIPVGDPKLAPLGDNGGPTQTMALLPGSAAIGIAISSVCQSTQIDNVDQRGMLRPINCDAGAFQTNASAMSATSSTPGALPPVSNLTATFPVSQ